MKKLHVFTIILMMAVVCLLPINAGAKTCADGEHVWGSWKTVSAATYSETGLKVRTCKNCDKTEAKTIAIKSTTSQQKKVKQTVDKFFEATKAYNTTKMKSCFTSSANPSLFIENKYMPKFMKKVNKKFYYDIKNIKVSGKKATVKVYCEYRSAYAAYTKAFSDLIIYLIENPKYLNKTSAIQKYTYQQSLKYYKNFEKEYSYKTITIQLKKTNGKWKISKWTNALSNAVHANYLKAYNDFYAS